MFRNLSLNFEEEQVNDLLNDRDYQLVKMQITCSEETAFTSVTLTMRPCEPRQRKYKRYLRRFMATEDRKEIDKLLEDETYRIIKLHSFPTSEGMVVVLDYQVKNER